MMPETFTLPKKNPTDFEEALRLVMIRDNKCLSTATPIARNEFPNLYNIYQSERRVSFGASEKPVDDLEFSDAVAAVMGHEGVTFATAFEVARKTWKYLYADCLAKKGVEINPETHMKIRSRSPKEPDKAPTNAAADTQTAFSLPGTVATGDFLSLVSNYRKVNNCGAEQAMKAVIKSDPEAHKSYLEKVNPNRALIR